MRILLDTNAIIFHAEQSPRLSQAAFELIDYPETEVYVSAISAAELACLQEKGKIILPAPWRDWFRRQISVNSWTCLAITQEIMEEAYSLPGQIHRDPADRIIVATARIEQMTVVTSDELILNYAHVKAMA